MKIGDKVICLKDFIVTSYEGYSIYKNKFYIISRINAIDKNVLIKDMSNNFKGIHEITYFITLEEFRNNKLNLILNEN